MPEISEELKIGNIDEKTLLELSYEKRLDSLREAKGDNWSLGPPMSKDEIKKERMQSPFDCSEWNTVYSEIYSSHGVGVFRPGKEAATDYELSHFTSCKCGDCSNKMPNQYDMLPVIMVGNENQATKITYTKDKSRVKHYTPWTLEHFSLILEELKTMEDGDFYLELIGTILVRMAYMLDHEKDNMGRWRLVIPSSTKTYINAHFPELNFHEGDYPRTVSTETLLILFDVLAINEEIKVDAKGNVDLKRSGKIAANGRVNTLLTYANVIATMIGRQKVSKIVFGYHRGRGMFSLKVDEFKTMFPLLSTHPQ